jgi:Phosphate/sulphate permeases
MSEIYTVIVVILGILAVSGLFVGVSNDAVNFLNSAIGSKAAPMKTILLVASIGILLGTVTSSGMMEVARNGMFNPGLFSFHEVMMLYMGVMFANVILLDLYNSMGLPTSTTVSLIFCLLGAAVAVSIYKISNDEALGMGDLNHFINTGRAMGIVSAILLSVVIAFTFGTLIMYISRLIFSFRYTAMFRRFGAFWCGASFTAILYFAVFKGLKTPLAGSAAIEWIDQHILLSLFLCWAVGSLLLFFLQRLKINILRLTILSGTFALALAFAGNDLVNFIGVPVAGFDAYSIARHAGDSTILMEGLNASVPANFLVLMTAGVIMIVTLWTSKKAMHVTETEISLSTQGESETQYGSSLFSRTIVRAALNASNAIDRTIPKRIRDKISSRFQYEDIERQRRPLRHDPRHGEPHDLRHAYFGGHVAQTAAFDQAVDKDIIQTLAYTLNQGTVRPDGAGWSFRLADGRKSFGKTGTSEDLAVSGGSFIPNQIAAFAVVGDAQNPYTNRISNIAINGRYNSYWDGSTIAAPAVTNFFNSYISKKKIPIDNDYGQPVSKYTTTGKYLGIGGRTFSVPQTTTNGNSQSQSSNNQSQSQNTGQNNTQTQGTNSEQSNDGQ